MKACNEVWPRGWLAKEIAAAKRDVATWPAWMKKAMKIQEAPNEQ